MDVVTVSNTLQGRIVLSYPVPMDVPVMDDVRMGGVSATKIIPMRIVLNTFEIAEIMESL